MSVLIVAWLVRHYGASLRRHGVSLVVALATIASAPASASEFKELLADAGSIVFGERDASDEVEVAVAPAPEAAPQDSDGDAVPATPVALQPIPGRDDSKISPDVLKGTPRIDDAKTGRDADELLRKLLPRRSDTYSDWQASGACLHGPGEPKALAPCVPPPPCDPSLPPAPFDLVGVDGVPSCGPIYRGPCEPRSTRNHHGMFAWCHHLWDRAFDCFYHSK